jgi:hypothetical protein
MTWIRRHWRALLALAPLLPPFVKGVLSFVGFGGSVDFVISRLQEPGWVAVMIRWLLDPPGWSILPMILMGLALIFWDSRRHRLGVAIAGDASKQFNERVGTPERDSDAMARLKLARVLDDLLAEGVAYRNEILPALPEFDEPTERAKFLDWDARALAAMDDRYVQMREKSQFRTLDRFQPEYISAPGARAKSPKQEPLEAIWNEKLRILRVIIRKLGS